MILFRFMKNYSNRELLSETEARLNCVKVVCGSQWERWKKTKLYYMHWLPFPELLIIFKQRFMKKIVSYGLSLSMMLTLTIACGNDASKTTNSKKDTTAVSQTKKDSTEVEESDKPAVS